MKYFSIFFLAFFIACKPSEKKLTAQQIIDKSIAVSGANKVSNAKISFTFREKEYVSFRKKNGGFTLIRNQKVKKIGAISDIVDNNGFKREINGLSFTVKDSLANSIANSVNSVHYFSVLPYGLNDKAVHKKILPTVSIKGKEYYKVEVTFSKDGGGEDFEDVFIYWVNKDSFLIDYLAYSYHTNGGGKRFRAINKEVIINGIRFVNYDNYKPLNNSISLVDIDKAFEENQLKKLSEINLENISVKLLD